MHFNFILLSDSMRTRLASVNHTQIEFETSGFGAHLLSCLAVAVAVVLHPVAADETNTAPLRRS